MKTYNYTIKDIESMSEANLADMADAVETIKGHTVYFVDFGGCFGFSACVCAEGQHIYYANDYEIHHRGKSRDELREIYRQTLNNKLFTESVLDHIGGLVSANIFPTKKRAREVADYWNRRFMENGTYFFDGGKTA